MYIEWSKIDLTGGERKKEKLKTSSFITFQDFKAFAPCGSLYYRRNLQNLPVKEERAS